MSATGPRSVLLIGYGNPGRLDDGLGPALAAALEERAIPGLTVDSDYQLTIEDAHAVAEHEVVVFADAAISGPEPFDFRRLDTAGETPAFSSHSVEPEQVLALAQDLFSADAIGYVLGVRGYEFDGFGERLTEKATENLAAAVGFIEGVIRGDLFEDAAAR
jgi:hydrogenase maturation protease